MSAPNSKVASIVSGIPGHVIEDLKLSDLTILHPGGGTAEDAARHLPEQEQNYPEPTMFGVTPAQGFFIRHAKGVEMSGIKIESSGEDARPVFVLDDVHGADFSFVKFPSSGQKANFSLANVREFEVFHSAPVADTNLPEIAKKFL
jgi:hypothetical protein